MKKNILLILIFILITACASNANKDQTTAEKQADLYYELGTNELVKKNYTEALNNLIKAKDLAPKDSRIRNNLGMTYYFKNQKELAAVELKEAISLDNKNSDAKINLATMYFENKRLKEARKLYEEVLTNLTFENQFRTYYNLALLDLAEGDRKGAFENLAKSLKEKEDYCNSHYKLGELYFEENNFKEALNSFREAGKGLCISEAAPIYQQAVTLINLERKTEAKKKFEQLIEKFPKSKYRSMAINQIKQIENGPAEENIATTKRKTEIITETPRF